MALWAVMAQCVGAIILARVVDSERIRVDFLVYVNAEKSGARRSKNALNASCASCD